MVNTSSAGAVFWAKCLNNLKYQVSNSEFNLWLRPLKVAIEQGTDGEKDNQEAIFVIQAPNDFFVDHLNKNYLEILKKVVLSQSDDIKNVVVRLEQAVSAMSDITGDDSFTTAKSSYNQQVNLFEDMGLSNENPNSELITNVSTANISTENDVAGNQSLSKKRAKSGKNKSNSNLISQSTGKIQDVDSDKSLNYIDPNYTFDTFVTGKSNNLAYKACYELSKRNSQNSHNPLFIYGHSGLGKTHLMNSVAHRYIKSNRSFYYFTSDKFVNQMVYALRQSKIDEFKKKIKKVDLLIIDDIHVLANKPKTITEFLSLFEDFTTGDKLLILASDRHPSQLKDFDERFRSRLSGGLSVSIDPPELDTRMQILQKKASLLNIDLPKECALFIAQNVVSNVRHLEGALNQVMANANLTGNEVSLEMVRYALKDIIAMRVQAVNMENIRKVVGEFYEISVKDMMGKKRSRNIVRPRQVAMALSRELTSNSYPEIGQSFGGRDHSTVMHACDKVAQLRAEDPVLDKEYKSLSMMLQAG